MIIIYNGADTSKEIKCVEKQIGWDIVHYTNGTPDTFKASVSRGYKRGRVIL